MACFVEETCFIWTQCAIQNKLFHALPPTAPSNDFFARRREINIARHGINQGAKAFVASCLIVIEDNEPSI